MGRLARYWAVALLLSILAQVHPAAAGRLEEIRARGLLVVGVKNEYPPFGMLDGQGRIVGLEPDLAADIARRLHVKLRLVAVDTADRMQKLAEGSVDLLIATVGDTAKRRHLADLIEPDYYASGVNIMLPRSRKIRDWTELRGQTVCSTQGAYFNRPMARRYLLDLRLYNGTRDAKLALRQGRCAGWLYDDVAIEAALASPEWRGYAMPLPSLLLSPWAMVIHRGRDGADFDRMIGDAIAEWHRTGFLIALGRKWHLKPNPFLEREHQLWTARGGDGAYLCRRRADGRWPVKCRNQALLGAAETGGLYSLGLRIRELTGLDFSILYDGYDRGEFLYGLLVSLALVAACVFGTLLTAALGAVLLDAGIPPVSRLARGVATASRMTPPLLQIYVVVFGIGAVTARWGLTLNAFAAAAACLSLYAGAASAEALFEAAAVIRHSRPSFRISFANLPPVFRLAYQPVVAALVNIVKATGMASTVAVPELINSTTAIVAERGNALVMMNTLMVAYFLMVVLVMRLFKRLHRRIAADVAG
ncbi:MAG TPA: transporter substrate-binding domain-containing protein [Stellaceae bacterium]|nr:transporter substrate-binding domain-containing protein [Stellaceae bacterium]